MDELLGEFVAECHDLLESLSVEIVEWEKDPSDSDRLDHVFRFFHTIKGNCGFFDFPRLARLSHAAEDTLSDYRSGRRKPDSTGVDAVLASIDTIRMLVEKIATGEDIPDDDDSALIAALRGEIVDRAFRGAEVETDNKDGKAASSATPLHQRTIRLPIELLDRVMSGVSDMALARNELARLVHIQADTKHVQASVTRLSTMLDDMRDAIQRIRMQRIDTLFASLPRLVRDLSQELGKQVMVELESGDVELDRELIEVIRDPLIHLLRNAVDHGIETPAERLAAGKREIGTLHISARQTGSEIRIGIVDDGRGMDTDVIVAQAIDKGLITQDIAETLTERQKTALICESGFSTARKVTSISGRGVGMDVVRSNLEAIGGSLIIDTTPGVGTRMMLNVPMTLSIVPAVVVKAGGQPFALPRSYVQEVVRSNDRQGRVRMGGRDFVTVDDNRMACAPLGDLLHLDSTNQKQEDGELFIVIRFVGGDLFALEVDEIVSLTELTIKPIAPILQDTGLYVGIAQLDDGSPVLALDVSGIGMEAGVINDKRVDRTAEQHVVETVQKPQSGVLFEQFDGKRRLIAMEDLQRIERCPRDEIAAVADGYFMAVDGKLLPVLGLPEIMPEAESFQLLHIESDESAVAFAFAEMIDIVDYHAMENAQDQPSTVLVDDKPVERLRAEELLARSNGQAKEQA